MAKKPIQVAPIASADPRVADCRRRLDEMKRAGAETRDINATVRELRALEAKFPTPPTPAPEPEPEPVDDVAAPETKENE